MGDDHFELPTDGQVPLITNSEDQYPESYDTVSIPASDAPTQINEITSTDKDWNTQLYIL